MACAGVALKVPVELTYQEYRAFEALELAVSVVLKGEVQLLRLAPVNDADGGAVTTIGFVKVVSARHPQLLINMIVG